MRTSNLQYFLDHENELLEKYGGKYIVIKDEQIVAAFNSLISAYKYAFAKFSVGTFLIQHCIPASWQTAT